MCLSNTHLLSRTARPGSGLGFCSHPLASPPPSSPAQGAWTGGRARLWLGLGSRRPECLWDRSLWTVWILDVTGLIWRHGSVSWGGMREGGVRLRRRESQGGAPEGVGRWGRSRSADGGDPRVWGPRPGQGKGPSEKGGGVAGDRGTLSVENLKQYRTAHRHSAFY